MDTGGLVHDRRMGYTDPTGLAGSCCLGKGACAEVDVNHQGQLSGITGNGGTVVLRTECARNPKDIWCFEVPSVAKDGYVYESAANVVTIQCGPHALADLPR
jgi:hypothetical protein